MLGIFIIIIKIMIRRNATDPSQDAEIKMEPELEENVIDYTDMSTKEKLKKLSEQLQKIDSLLPREDYLNDMQKRLIGLKRLKNKIDMFYEAERKLLVDAINWLEKPEENRGKFKMNLSNRDGSNILTIEQVNETVELMRIIADGHDWDEINQIFSKGFSYLLKPVAEQKEIELFTVPNIKLSDLLNKGYVVIQYWPTIKPYFGIILNELNEVAKYWYVILNLAYLTLTDQETIKKIIETQQKVLQKFVNINVIVDIKSDISTIVINFIPGNLDKFNRFFTLLKNRIQSLFDIEQWSP
ncbi:uncharacterized protein LOC126901996 isoform X1 [Daktulosphaira vitifoliae]|uniref:uncharacterized protein LOC126901996 isoform X1 n=2 Tax=Daktulosphaira vitifoliae TaxID=58002 RepID=UPI0021A9ADB1|nr:uncharacterized protein LOC126901996 isoform X1 [Daktulosphaira vitifoliae]